MEVHTLLVGVKGKGMSKSWRAVLFSALSLYILGYGYFRSRGVLIGPDMHGTTVVLWVDYGFLSRLYWPFVTVEARIRGLEIARPQTAGMVSS